MKIENHHGEEAKTSEKSVYKVLLSGIFTRKKKEKKKRSSPPPPHGDPRLIRRDKSNKNMHMSLSEMMRKLKHSFKKEKPQHDNKRLLLVGKKKGRSLSTTTTKDHFFLERMTLISPKKIQHQHVVKEKQYLSFENGHSSDHNVATSEKYAHRRTVSLLPGYISPFRSPGKALDQNSTLLSKSASDNFMKSETLTEIEKSDSLSQDSSSPSLSNSSHNFVTFEISQLEASDVEKDDENSHEKSLPQASLLYAASPSHCISRTDEYELVLDPLFIGYEISPSRGEAKRQTLCHQFEEKDDPMDEKETVFKYVKAVLDAIDSSWEDMYLKTEFSDQILNPALFSNITFYPSQLCAANHNHELLFDSINELIFEFCRFPQWLSFVKPRTQVFSFSDESIINEVQKEVYYRLFPLQFADSVDQIMREDMDKRGNWWLDVRCEVECIGFETSELILDELLEELMLDL
ncbi:TRM33 [Hirschfeldia incana]|nr:TRM33 [Hirschfeldia incana]